MTVGGFDFCLFTNAIGGTDYFIAKKSYVEKKAAGMDADKCDVKKIAFLPEEYLYEMDASGVDYLEILETSGNLGKTKIIVTRFEHEAASAIKHGKEYDFRKIFI
jgi:hypothetical protein